MLNKPLSITQIHKEISFLSQEELLEVENFIQSLSNSQLRKKNVVNLEGVWAGKGFEKLDNLEEALKSIQKEIGDNLLKREW